MGELLRFPGGARSVSGDPDEPSAGAPDGFAPIEHASLRALGRRGLSRRELERSLGARGYDDAAIAAELARLESVGLIDDHELARHLVERLQQSKGAAPGAIRAELARRRLDRAAIDAALEALDASDEVAQACELATRRASRYQGLEPAVAARRLTGFLLRRGYSGDAVRAAVDAALAADRP